MTTDLELLYSLTESDIEPWFNPSVLDRARRLYHTGQVYNPVRQGPILAAEVQGEDDFLYDVAIAVTAELVRAECDCESNDYCEHIGAVLLNWIKAPGDFMPDGDVFPLDFIEYMQELPTGLENKAPMALNVEEWIPGRMLPDQNEAEALARQNKQIIEQELRELTSTQTIQQLRAIARRRGWKLHGTRKDDLVGQLVRLYLESPDASDAVEALDDTSRLTIEYLALRASVTPVLENLASKTIRGLRGRRSAREASAILKDLQSLGLIFAIKSYNGVMYRTPLAVVRQAPPWPGLLSPFGGDPAQLDVRRSPAFALTQVTYQVWQYLGQLPTPKKARALRPLTSLEKRWSPLQGWLNPTDELAEMERQGSRFWYDGWQRSISVQFSPPALPDADMAELQQRTGATDDILNFAFSLLTSVGLVRWQYGSEIQINKEEMAAFLVHSDTKRLASLTTAWIGQSWWSEMALVLQHVKRLQLRRSLGMVDLTYNDLLQELAQARAVVIMLLRRLSPDTWYGVADFRQLLRGFWPDYLHTDSTSPTPYWWLEIAGSDYRLSPNKTEDWEAGYAPFVTACLEGPLAWLGVVRLAYDRQGLAAFQLTELGAYLLGLRESYSTAEKKPSAPPLTVHGDGMVIARTGHATTGAYDVLNVAARLHETSAQQFRYYITAESVQYAFDQGWTGQTILDELEKHSGAPVPETLQRQILSWAEGYGQVHLYNEVTLVEFADDFALQELLASTSLARHLVYQFSPRLVAIKAEAVDTLRDELVHLGHTPRIE